MKISKGRMPAAAVASKALVGVMISTSRHVTSAWMPKSGTMRRGLRRR
ncbi:MAG: hypothetical protein P1V36_07430 [Planctomycetota bacterium]|nr:hypothetical protein [Planctomycetota bacterium]